jgi:hypothetical protein
MGLRDVALGYDQYSADNAKGSEPHLVWFFDEATKVPSAERVTRGTVRACQFQPDIFRAAAEAIVALLASLASRVQA